MIIHPLAQRRLRWDLRKSQSFTEKIIFPVLLDGRIVALRPLHNSDFSPDHSSMTSLGTFPTRSHINFSDE
jgi:hypothetical protein